MSEEPNSPAKGIEAAKLWSDSHKEFIGREKQIQYWIKLRPEIVDVAGEDLPSGILLNALLYWFLPHGKQNVPAVIVRNGVHWVARSRNKWWNECRLTPKQADRALRKLKDQRLIFVTLRKFSGTPIHHIAINWEELCSRLKDVIVQKVRSDVSKRSDSLLPTVSPDFDQSGKSITQNTAQNYSQTDEEDSSALDQFNSVLQPPPFSVPTLEDVVLDLQKAGYADAANKAQQFFKHYEDRGWLIADSRIRDWKKVLGKWKKTWNAPGGATPPRTAASSETRHQELLTKIEATKRQKNKIYE